LDILSEAIEKEQQTDSREKSGICLQRRETRKDRVSLFEGAHTFAARALLQKTNTTGASSISIDN
jgi:hypothetical protein